MTLNLPDLARQIAPFALAGLFVVAGLLAALFIFPERPIPRFLSQFTAFFGFTVLLVVAGVFPTEPTPNMALSPLVILISGLKIVWWLAASWLLSGFFRAILVYKRLPRETRLLQDLVSGFIYICAVLGIIADVFDIPVTGVLAASGVIAIVLGLALQSTLGDVFSGIVLNLAKPYRPGDWVILDDKMQGRVIETNWRATQILTDSHDLAIIPNSIIAKAKLVNASQPAQVHGITLTIRLDPAVAPSRSCSVLNMALLGCNQILRTPAANVMVRQLDALALECEVQFFVATFDESPAARNVVFDQIFRQCALAGIRLAPPPGSPLTLPPSTVHPGSGSGSVDGPRRLLDHVPIFALLAEEERVALAAKMKRQTYQSGDVLIEKGTIAQALFILSSGVLVALQGNGAGDGEGEGEVTRLAPGECFGQAGVLTGAAATFKVTALTKVIVYEIAKDDLVPILRERPAIAAELGQILARREAVGKSRLEDLNLPKKPDKTLIAQLADRMKDFLGLT